MKVTETPLNGVLLIEPRVFADARGFFFESYNQKDFFAAGIHENFVQDNLSRSVRGTLRGLHYQLNPHAQGKLVRCTSGEVFDVALDLRKGSTSFGKWFGAALTAENKLAMYIPPGFAHGFLAPSETAEFSYKCTALYEPTAERTIKWDDPAVGIRWPIDPSVVILSEKDKKGLPLSQADVD